MITHLGLQKYTYIPMQAGAWSVLQQHKFALLEKTYFQKSKSNTHPETI
jgi:hypothetical protein